MPKMPHFVKVTESRKGRAAIVSWHGAKVFNDTLVPPTVIYVLQFRHILSPKPNWGFNTPWLAVTQVSICGCNNACLSVCFYTHFWQFVHLCGCPFVQDSFTFRNMHDVNILVVGKHVQEMHKIRAGHKLTFIHLYPNWSRSAGVFLQYGTHKANSFTCTSTLPINTYCKIISSSGE